ncbi:hypothetical protein AMR42_14540 [Limnothrix sp. PR1529]|nr:hypothetical protein BCR12_02260 [Limnothrix sp. P13C2]PIB07076.1 hypothetical protein AMR42_14540 [Limnothrix sp. PR1529]
MKAIIEYWKNESSTFDFLCEVINQNSFIQIGKEDFEYEKSPRCLALKGLLEIAPDDQRVIDLLRDRAANDPDDLLRQWATEQLTKIAPQ